MEARGNTWKLVITPGKLWVRAECRKNRWKLAGPRREAWARKDARFFPVSRDEAAGNARGVVETLEKDWVREGKSGGSWTREATCTGEWKRVETR